MASPVARVQQSVCLISIDKLRIHHSVNVLSGYCGVSWRQTSHQEINTNYFREDGLQDNAIALYVGEGRMHCRYITS